MPTMSFLPRLQEFLLDNGFIFTVRKYRMTRAVVDIDGVGKCNRIPITGVVSRETLLPYLKSSGFPTLEDWWAKIRYFTPNKNLPLYLYKVEVIK